MADRKKCPKCGKTGDVEKKFGYRFAHGGGPQVAQSWCFECRGSASPPPSKRTRKPTFVIPKTRAALIRAYRTKTGDKKIRANAFMVEALQSL